MAALEHHRAAQEVRARQQGYGKGIISWTDRGHRLVAVGSTVFWSTQWRLFPDFLMHFLKHTLGFNWGERERSRNSTHPLFRWLKKFEAYRREHESGALIKTAPLVGYAGCIFHLAYALYLLAHNDQIPKLLLRRLRDENTFLPAYYEALVGAACAVAGLEVRCEELARTSKATPEYTARSRRSGREFKVEAKRKRSWSAPTSDLGADDFNVELRGYIRDQLHATARKRLKSAVLWIELSIPTIETAEQWAVVAKAAARTIRDAETTITLDGESPPPAYVFVTNNTFLANEDVGGAPTFAVIEAFRIPDYVLRPGEIDLEAAMECYDQHRDFHWIQRCLEIAVRWPSTFDGTPVELLKEDGTQFVSIKIGQRFEFPDENGNSCVGPIEDIVSVGEKAMAIVLDEATKRRSIVSIPLADEELRAIARYGDLVFGKRNVGRKLRDDDPLDFYDWLLECYATVTREKALEFLSSHPRFAEYCSLETPALRVRLCREWTKGMWATRSSPSTERG